MAYTPHAQIVQAKDMIGRTAQPTPAELVPIEHYRSKYVLTFGVELAGVHWLDDLGKWSCFAATAVPLEASLITAGRRRTPIERFDGPHVEFHYRPSQFVYVRNTRLPRGSERLWEKLLRPGRPRGPR
jgi:hypothetical protein